MQIPLHQSRVTAPRARLCCCEVLLEWVPWFRSARPELRSNLSPKSSNAPKDNSGLRISDLHRRCDRRLDWAFWCLPPAVQSSE